MGWLRRFEFVVHVFEWRKGPAIAGLMLSGKLPLDHMPVSLARIEPRAREVRAVGAVGEGLGFKGDAAGFVKAFAVRRFHSIGEMLGEVELQSGLG